MNRVLLSSLLAVCASLSLAADISFETRATTLDKALDLLSKQNNVQIKAVGPISRQVVVIKVEKQPMEAFLKHLCSTLSAAATNNNGVIEIAESLSLIKADEEVDRARVAKGFAKSIAEQTKNIATTSFTEEELFKRLTEYRRLNEQMQQSGDQGNEKLYEQTMLLQESMPAPVLVRRLVATLSPAELAAMPSDSRTVYATGPTRMQRAFNANGQKVLTQFASEYQRISAAVNRFPREQHGEMLGTMGMYQFSSAPAKVLLSCMRYAGDNVSIEASVLDNRGRVIAGSSMSITANMPDDGAEKGSKAEDNDKSELPLKVSEESKTYFALMSRGVENQKGGIEVVQEPLRTKVLNPEQHDPLGYGITDLLLAAAADRKKPMIVLVPDSAQLIDVSGTPKASDFFTMLRNTEQVIMSDVDGWLLGKPFHPEDARRKRLLRGAYGSLVRSITKNQKVSLDDLSGFALAQKVNPGYDSFYVTNLYSLFGSLVMGFDLSAWEQLRFYGFLGDTNRKNMAGKTVAFSSLPRDAQDEISTLMYKQPSMGFSFGDVAVEASEDSMAIPCSDPTERMPNGIPGDTQVLLQFTTEAVAIPVGAFGFPMGAAELASSMAMQERPDLFPWSQENRVGDRFRTATRLYYDFQFTFAQNLSHSIQLWDFAGVGKDTLSLAQMPAEFKSQYETALKEIRESYKGLKPEDLRGGRTGPPPPLR